MRKIHFNDETINEIRNFIQQEHTKRETCNRFTIKIDTLNRIMRENNIEPYYVEKRNTNCLQPISEETKNLVCNLFELTDTRLQDIVKEANIEYWQLQEILNSNFTEEQINNRKAKLYRKSNEFC